MGAANALTFCRHAALLMCIRFSRRNPRPFPKARNLEFGLSGEDREGVVARACSMRFRSVPSQGRAGACPGFQGRARGGEGGGAAREADLGGAGAAA